MKKFLVLVFVLAFSMGQFCPAALCQEEEMDYSYGTVTAVSENSVTITEISYDEDTGERIQTQVVYETASDIKIDNAASVKEIPVGKEVDVEFITKDGKKQAKYIYVYSGGEFETGEGME